MKKSVFSVLNNVPHIAERLPRMPTAEMMMYIRREHTEANASHTFRPAKVNAALDWLIQHNPLYLPFAGLRDVLDETEPARDVDNIVEISEEDAEAVSRRLAGPLSTTNGGTVEGENVLLFTEAPTVDRDDHIAANLRRAPEYSGAPEFYVPAAQPPPGGGEQAGPTRSKYPHPRDDPDFYAKAFPCLFPYGVHARPPTKNNKPAFSMAEFVRLLLLRGGSFDTRRFTFAPFLCVVYGYRMQKLAGGASFLASKMAEAAGHSAARRTEGDEATGAAANNFLAALASAPSAAEVLSVLRGNKGALSKKILRSMEPFSDKMSGTPGYIANERKKLYAMIGSAYVLNKGQPLIFGTNSPNDRQYPELPKIVSPDNISLNTSERVALLRQYPVLAARLFKERIDAHFKYVVKGEHQPFGKVTDSWVRVEFQGAR